MKFVALLVAGPPHWATISPILSLAPTDGGNRKEYPDRDRCMVALQAPHRPPALPSTCRCAIQQQAVKQPFPIAMNNHTWQGGGEGDGDRPRPLWLQHWALCPLTPAFLSSGLWPGPSLGLTTMCGEQPAPLRHLWVHRGLGMRLHQHFTSQP